MDNTRLVNLLIATASSGELAESIRNELFEAVESIMEDDELKYAFVDSVEAFVNVLTEFAVQAIVATRGNEEVVAEFIARSYGTGLALGIAMAVKAAEG